MICTIISYIIYYSDISYRILYRMFFGIFYSTPKLEGPTS